MIGLALAAKELAYARACESIGRPWYSWIVNPLDWVVNSRLHARQFPGCPTAYYYQIIDNISAGRKP